MNKKLLDKQNKLKIKKQQDKQRQLILKQLTQHQLSKQDMDQMVSIKHSTSTNKLQKTKIIHSKQDIEQIQEETNDLCQLTTNIFATQQFQQQALPPTIQNNDNNYNNLSSSDRLIFETKKLIPDLVLDSFNQKPIPQHQKSQIKQQQQQEEEEEIDIFNDDVYDFDPQLLLKTDELLLTIQTNLTPKYLERNPITEQSRKQLPITLQENEIVDSIKENLITLICGETGCGKSTQIPQFLYDAGFTDLGMIAITQPRRLATISLAQRVAQECNFKLGQEISYQVKNETSGFNKSTVLKVINNNKNIIIIKFMTDGILLNELQTTVLLPQYSVIIIDEAHERKVNIDLLIGILSRVVLLRARMNQPLRLIIMSATLRIEDFMENKNVFPRALNLIRIQSRQYPVQTFFNKVTKEDYMAEAIEKCVKIHQKLPAGDVLIFLTGQKEIKICCKLLRERLENVQMNQYEEQGDDIDDENANQESSSMEQQEELIDDNVYGKNDYKELKQLTTQQMTSSNKEFKSILEFEVVPLYSKLDMRNQTSIFSNSLSSQKRMIVVATNVAETSITIPSVRYVIDCGKQKRKHRNEIGLERHVIEWISQASADQRSGRAGRTGPGYCYRLYSTGVYGNVMKKYSPVEILESGLQNVILQMKCIGIKDVNRFPYLSPPKPEQIEGSLRELAALGGLKGQYIPVDQTKITELGQVLNSIGLIPRYGKLLLQSRQMGMLHYGVILACLMVVDQLIDVDSFNLVVPNDQPQKQKPNKRDDDDDEMDQFKQQLHRIEKEEKEMKEQLARDRVQYRCIKQFLNKWSHGVLISDFIPQMNIIGNIIKQLIQEQQDQEIEKVLHQYSIEHHLIPKSLKDVYYNFLQLMEIFENLITDKKEINFIHQQIKQYQHPTQQEAQLIAKLIIQTNGLPQVAQLQQKLDPTTNTLKFYYASSEIPQMYIHPSSLIQHNKHQFVIYHQIITQKHYMLNNTIIQDLTLLYQIDHRTDQQKKLTIDHDSVFYQSQTDSLVALASATINQTWHLSSFHIPYPLNTILYYVRFAHLLLQGSILSYFKSTQKLYKYSPNTISENNMQQYSQAIITTLQSNSIHNQSTILTKWQQQPTFFLQQFLLIVQPKYHTNVTNKWPPKN